MVVIKLKKSFLVLTFLITSSILITSIMDTTATVPTKVNVHWKIYKFKWLNQDGDTFGKGDIYFKVTWTGTLTSGIAHNDYSDSGSPQADLSNPDFDGSGYYDKLQNNILLDLGPLDWTIKVYDYDSGEDDLLFKGKLTVKVASTTGIREYNDVWCNIEYVLGELHYNTFDNSYLTFRCLYSAEKHDAFNGLRLWITLNYHT